MARYSFEESAARHELQFWGFHNGKCIAWEGFSVENTIARLLEGWGGTFEHRVLMKDFPDTPRGQEIASKFWRINSKVMLLTNEQREVVIARYCVPPKVRDDNKIEYYTRRELADACNLSEWEFRNRLREAIRRYRSLIFDDSPKYLRSKKILATESKI